MHTYRRLFTVINNVALMVGTLFSLKFNFLFICTRQNCIFFKIVWFYVYGLTVVIVLGRLRLDRLLFRSNHLKVKTCKVQHNLFNYRLNFIKIPSIETNFTLYHP